MGRHLWCLPCLSSLNKLTTHDKYQGRDRVHTADGNGLKINHIGHSILHIPNRSLHLKKILHVPSASKNLLSVHKLTLDNHVFIEYHPFFLFDKGSGHEEFCLKVPVKVVSTR
jgi:hypothetical protein